MEPEAKPVGRRQRRSGRCLAVVFSLCLTSAGCKRDDQLGQAGQAGQAGRVGAQPAQPAPSSSTRPPADGGARTHQKADSGFSVSLPSGWTELPQAADGAALYQAADGAEQLTVRVLGSGARVFDRAKRAEALTRLLEVHQRTLRRATDFRAELGPAKRSSKGEVDQVRYSGMDWYAHRAFSVAILISSTGAWAFTLESLKSGQAALEQRAATIFDSVVVQP